MNRHPDTWSDDECEDYAHRERFLTETDYNAEADRRADRDWGDRLAMSDAAIENYERRNP